MEKENERNENKEDIDILGDLTSLAEQVNQFMEEAEQLNQPDDFLEHEIAASEENLETIDESIEQNQETQEEGSPATETMEDSVKMQEETVAEQENKDDTVKEDVHNEGGELFIEQEPELSEINDSLAQQVENAINEDSKFQEHLKKKKKRRRIILSCVGAVFALIAGLAIFLSTKAGQKAAIRIIAQPIYDSTFDYVPSDPMDTAEQVDETLNFEEVIDKEEKVANQDIVNILLIGIEENKGAKNTDAMIIASLNRKTDELSIISLMRDIYVSIPGHDSNKLNAAYGLGGIDLLRNTICQNFGISLDGYILVDYEAFETIVDLLGGVEVTLTQNEANYLNKHNYISNPAYRNVHAGRQIMNGNQALGYCRIRYVSTGKESNDFGRTARQRVVLNAMFEQLKNKNVFQLINFMNDVFAEVQLKTDISKNKFSDYLTEVVDLNLSTLEQYRIPENDQYVDDKVRIGKRKTSVLLIKDWNDVRQTLKQYMNHGTEETVE